MSVFGALRWLDRTPYGVIFVPRLKLLPLTEPKTRLNLLIYPMPYRY